MIVKLIEKLFLSFTPDTPVVSCFRWKNHNLSEFAFAAALRYQRFIFLQDHVDNATVMGIHVGKRYRFL